MTQADSDTTMKPTQEPEFDMEEFEDILITSNQHDKHVTIKYEAYYYEGAFRLVKCEVNLSDSLPCFFDYLEDQILEAIGLRVNKTNVVLETGIIYK